MNVVNVVVMVLPMAHVIVMETLKIVLVNAVAHHQKMNVVNVVAVAYQMESVIVMVMLMPDVAVVRLLQKKIMIVMVIV
jgi:hypothetical protein